jgi:RNA polymerase sigma factor (sigma-70 family)
MNGVIKHLRRAALLPDGAGHSDGQLLIWFIERGDEAAFEALVRRHGPMVMSVCRRLLGHHQDAEDAFQATFLVLARKAASIVPPEKVANWLHGVAYHTAWKAKARRAKRLARERQVVVLPEREAPPQEFCQGLRLLLDQELTRLPEKYRLPILLCDLEGKPIKEAAHSLGWPQGTLAGRLARGRTLLAKRLARRGIVLSVGALVAGLSENAAPASVSTCLVSSTVKAATLCAAGQAIVAGLIPAKVAALTEGIVVTMVLNKVKTLSLALLALVLVAFGGSLAVTYATPEDQPDQDETNPKPPMLATPAPANSLGKVKETQFVINTELAELNEDGKTSIITRPQIMTLEDQQAAININWDVGSRHPNIADAFKDMDFGTRFEITVRHVDAEKAQIDLNFTTYKVAKAEKLDTVVLAHDVRAIRQVELGKRSKFVLSQDRQGNPLLWFELTVTEAQIRRGAVLPPRKAAPQSHSSENTGRSWPFIP